MDTSNTAMNTENTVMETAMVQPDVATSDTAVADPPIPEDPSDSQTPVEDTDETSGSPAQEEGGHWCQKETEYITQKNVSSVENQTLQYQDCEEAQANGWPILEETTVEDIWSCTVIK